MKKLNTTCRKIHHSESAFLEMAVQFKMKFLSYCKIGQQCLDKSRVVGQRGKLTKTGVDKKTALQEKLNERM